MSKTKCVRRWLFVLNMGMLFSSPLLVAQEIPPHQQETPPKKLTETSGLTGQIVYELLLGEIAASRGQLDVAVEAYLDLSKSTSNPDIARRAVEVSLYGQNLSAAKEAAAIWVKADPKSTEARKIMAEIEGDTATQLAGIETKLAELLAQSDEKRPNALMSLYPALENFGNASKRRALIERVTTPYLNLSEAHFARAQAQAGDNDLKAALSSLDAALLRSRDWEPAVLYKAQLQNLDDPDASIHLLEDYLSRHPDSRGGKIEYSRALVSARRGEEALKVLQSQLDAAPTDQDMRYACGMLALENGEFETARTYFETLLKANYRGLDGVRLGLGELSERTRDYAAAERWFRQIEEPANRSAMNLKIAYAMAKQDKLAQAREFLASQAETEKHSNAAGRMLEAQLLKQLKRYSEAFDLAQTALEESPEDPELIYDYAMIAEAADRVPEMEKALKKVIALKPDDPQALNALGYSWADRGLHLEESQKLIEAALKLLPNDSFIMDSQAWLLVRQNKLEQALPILEKAYRKRQDPEVGAHLGELLWRLGRKEESLRFLKNMQRAHPDSDLLNDTLQRLTSQSTSP